MDQTIGVKDDWKFLAPALALFASLEVLMWVHWNSLVETAQGWDKPKYQYGYLVPLCSVFLLWLWRDPKQEISVPATRAGIAAAVIGLILSFIPVIEPDWIVQLSGMFGRTSLEAVGVTLTIAGGLLILQPHIDMAAVSQRDRWIGFCILVGSQLLRYWATVANKATIDDFSIVPAIAGVVIMIGGLPIMRWASWPVFLLIFMLPLPAALDAQSGNLQLIAARASTFLLQTTGLQAHREGHAIIVGDPLTAEHSNLDVADACSGLRMLTILGGLCFFMALIFTDRPLWQRMTIVLSSVPIALTVNIMRITATGVLFASFPHRGEEFHHFVHDMWGLVMMPLAMALIFMEFKVLSALVIEEDEDVLPPGALVGMQRSPAQQLASGGRIASVATGGPRAGAAPVGIVSVATAGNGSDASKPTRPTARPGTKS